jgi:Family of unknown function (DUF5675)
MVPTQGFCIELNRLRSESRAGEPDRTIGDYRCHWNGELLPGMTGQMVECRGPGDNTYSIGNMLDRRIEQGIYPLALHHSAKFSTLNYVASDSPAAMPRPAIRLARTKERQGILIHPAKGWKWSTGCLNPASGLSNSSSNIDYVDSRRQVIAIIDFLKSKASQVDGKVVAPLAVIWIKGEPTS